MSFFAVEHNSSLGSLIKSATFTLRHLAIKASVFRSGCTVFPHHLLTVHADFPTCSANHLLVFSCSARTAFIRFNLAILVNKNKLWFNVNLMTWHSPKSTLESYTSLCSSSQN